MVDSDGHARIKAGAAKMTGGEDSRDRIKGERVIYDLALLDHALRQLQACKCGGHAHLARSADGTLLDNRQGLAHEFTFACDACGATLATAPTSAKLPSDAPGRPAMEINRLAAFSGDLSAVRRSAQTKFLNGMGVDGLQDNKAYAAHGAHLHSILEELSEAQLRKNRALVRAHMVEVHGAEPDEHGRVGIMVSADGSWAIRGYSSCSGQGALIYEDGEAFPPTVIGQQCRGRYCGKCMWYENNEPTYVVPPHLCPRNYDGSSKSMEADILCHLVEEIAMYVRLTKAGDSVEVPMEERLHVEDVCCDEDSSFSLRLTDGGILKFAAAPRKLSDLNHLSGCLFKRLKKLKADKFRGTHMFSTKVVDCICQAYRLCVKQNKQDPQRARAQILNALEHYWGDHSNCREYDVKDENGESKIWCGFHREGEKYKFSALPKGEPLPLEYVKKGKKDKDTGEREPDLTINIKAEVIAAMGRFLEIDLLEQATSGKSTNYNEALHQRQISMLGGKHRFQGQAALYTAIMNASVVRMSIGETYIEDVYSAAGLPLSDQSKDRLSQAEKGAQARRLYHKKVATKRLRAKRKMVKKHRDWVDRGSKDYGKGVALEQKKKDVVGDADAGAADEGHGLKTEADEDRRARARDAAKRQGDADEDEGENSDDGGSEYEEEEEEVVPVMCLLCCGTVIGADDYMLICSKECCGEAAHRTCTEENGFDTPRGMRRSDAFLNAAKDWICPACQYRDIICSSEDPDVPAG